MDRYFYELMCDFENHSLGIHLFPSCHGLRISPDFPQIGVTVIGSKGVHINFEISDGENWHLYTPIIVDGILVCHTNIGDRYLLIDCPLPDVRISVEVFDKINRCKLVLARADTPKMLRKVMRAQEKGR